MQYIATYYDGLTSQPHEAKAEVFGNSLSIYYGDNKVVWAVSETDYGSFAGVDKVMLQYGKFPHQYLELKADSPLVKVLSEYLPTTGGRHSTKGLSNSTFVKAVLITLTVVSAILVGLYFVLLPMLASYVMEKVPISAEVALGDKFYQSFIAKEEIDEHATKVLNDFAGKIDFRTHYPLKFTVVENKEINAFAMPGGHVVVYSGILQRMKTPEELAALLAHEVTHIKQRHSLKGLTRNLTGSLFISMIFGDSGPLSSVLVNKADEVYQLGFSREMEKEADLVGLKTMTHNKIDMQGMLRLMELLQKEEKVQGASGFSSYLQSHPMTDERIDYIKEHCKNKQPVHNEGLSEIWSRMNGESY